MELAENALALPEAARLPLRLRLRFALRHDHLEAVERQRRVHTRVCAQSGATHSIVHATSTPTRQQIHCIATGDRLNSFLAGEKSQCTRTRTGFRVAYAQRKVESIGEEEIEYHTSKRKL